MQSTSTTYKNLLNNINHTFGVRLNIGGTIYGKDAIFSAKASSRLFDTEPTIGGTYSNTFEFSVILPSGTNVARMATVVPQFRAEAGGTTSTWYTYGTYFIDTREVSQNDSGLTVFKAFCYDAMLKANADYGTSSLSWPATDTTVVGEIATKMGVTVDSRTTTLMNKGYTIPTVPVGYTLRDILSYIAVMYGGNWIITPANKLRLVPIAGGTDTLAVGKSAANLTVSPTRPAYTKLQVSVSEDTDAVIESGSSDDTVMTAVCPFITQAIVNTVFTSLSAFQYKPFTANGVWSDPAVELGDIVTINGFTAPVMAIDTSFGSGMVMELSAPNDNYIDHEYAYESPTSRSYKKTMGQMSTAIEQNEEAVRITAEKLSNIGGRNYAWAVSKDYHENNFIIRNCTSTYDPSQNGKYVLTASAASSSFTQISTGYYDMPSDLIGQKVIFHADVIEPSRTELDSKVYIVVGNSASSQIVAYALTPYTKSLTFTVPSNAAKLNVLLRVAQTQSLVEAGDTLTVSGVKLERGTVATDWTPAPEDDASAIAANKSAIEVNAEGISSKVSNTDYNGQTIASLINQTATDASINAQKINLTGYVTASSLTASGTTTIDGSRITTGYISADRIAASSITAAKINLSDLFSQNITASNMHITGGSVYIDSSDSSATLIKLNAITQFVSMNSYGLNMVTSDSKALFTLNPIESTSGAISTNMVLYGLDNTTRNNAELLNVSPSGIRARELATSRIVSLYGSSGLSITYGTNTFTYDAPNGLSMYDGTKTYSFGTANGLFMYAGSSKYSAMIWPDSNGAGRFVLGDGTSTKWRTELTNSGLVFRNASDAVTAQYPADNSTIRKASSGSSTSMTTGTATKMVSIDLTPGVWVMSYMQGFGSNATGYRTAYLTTNASSTSVSQSLHAAATTIMPVSGVTTYAHLTATTRVTAQTTVYGYAIQTSGGNLSGTGYINAVRIA